MAYGRKYTPRRNTPRTPRSARNTPRKKYSKKMPMVSFTKKVNQIISANVENKYTNSLTQIGPVCKINEEPGGDNYLDFFTFSPGAGATGIFQMSQGVAQNQRIGNTIKLKRWVIKGLIQPNPNLVVNPENAIPNSLIGYVEIFFGRYNSNTIQVQPTLENFYQNGASAITPVGSATTILYPVNKDLYKIYYRKRFKMGNLFPDPNGINTTNNDYSLTRTFGFEVTKFICKNKLIKYQDAVTFPQDNMIDNLTMWAVFYPAFGDLSVLTVADNVESYYQINAQTYAEYEDA